MSRVEAVSLEEQQRVRTDRGRDLRARRTHAYHARARATFAKRQTIWSHTRKKRKKRHDIHHTARGQLDGSVLRRVCLARKLVAVAQLTISENS